MSQTFFAILTAVGEAKDANAKALGTPIVITHMAVGDGAGVVPVPVSSRTTLFNEVRRAPLNQLSRDPINLNQVIAEQVIPENVGGWWIREIGLIDEDGDLIAIANCPPTYKPQLAEGSGRTQVVRMILIVSGADAVQLKIDPAVVLATRKYADDAITASMAAHLAAADPHPQYTTAAELSAAIFAAEGRLIGVKVFTASGTYTPTPGTKSVVVAVQAGGGAGGGCAATSGSAAIGGGGGGGAYAKGRFTAAQIGASQTLTIGAGGAPVTGGTGSNGGTSSFGALVSAAGGVGGGTAGASTSYPFNAHPGSTMGTFAGANIVGIVGAAGDYGLALTAAFFGAGKGGTSALGAGGHAASNSGGNGGARGGGGSGAASSGTFGARPGGAGGDGLIIVWEFA